MKSLVRFGLAQSVLMNLVFVSVVVAAAIFAIPRLPVDRYPNFSFGEFTVTVRWPGASAADVERLVAKVIEDSIRGMDDLEYVKSSSIAGQADINVKFIDDTDYDDLEKQLKLRVLAAQNRLPAANGKPLTPVFAKVETDQWLPVLQVSVVPDAAAGGLGRRQLTLLAKELQTRLENLDAVKRVELWGDEPEQLVVGLDPARLRQHGVALAEVEAALLAAGITEPAGTLATDAGERLVRVDGRFRSLEEVLAVGVRRLGDGGLLRVGDLADPEQTGVRSLDGGVRVSLDGKDAVSCKVLKQPWADATKVKAAVEAELRRFAQAHPAGGFSTVISLDSTVAIADSVGVLSGNLIQGFCLIVIVMTVIMGLRAAALSLSGMVFSFTGTLFYFWYTGASINEISLLGFVIVVGILVDDAVVVIDNIARHREEGKPLDRALVDGTAEVFWPVVSSVATTMASFLPLFLMTGVVGQFFALMPAAVVVALLLSLIEAVLMLPAHVRDLDRAFGPPRVIPRTGDDAGLGYIAQPGIIGWAARRYDGLLGFCIRRPWTAVMLTGGLFLLAIGVLVQSAAAPFIGMQPLVKLKFFPSDASIAEVRVTMPTGTPLAATDAKVREIAAHIAAKGRQQTSSVQGIAGMTVDSTYKPQFGSQHGLLQVELAGAGARSFDDPNAWIRGLGDELVARFAADGVRVAVEAQQGGPPAGQPINVRVAGLDDATVRAAARDLLRWMEAESAAGGQLRGAKDLASDLDRRDAILDVRLDRDRLARLGIAEAEAARFAASLVEGAYIGDLRRSDEDIPIKLRISRDALAAPGAADLIPLRTLPDGQTLRLADVGAIRYAEEPSELIRRDFVRTVTITGNLRDDSPINAFQAVEIVQRWRDANLAAYPGVVIAFGGEAESTGRSYVSLIGAFAVSIAVIFTILAMQFRSYLQPLLIMSSIVFSLTGVILLMGVFGLIANVLGPAIVRPERALFTVNTFIAVVALTGMVVNNAIILIDFINNRRQGQGDLLRVLRESGHLRLRAVLLTTTTTIFGFLPTAIGIPSFNLTWSPLATAFVAGLMLSTILTLLVVPALYLLLERHRRRIGMALGGLVGLLVLALAAAYVRYYVFGAAVFPFA